MRPAPVGIEHLGEISSGDYTSLPSSYWVDSHMVLSPLGAFPYGSVWKIG